MSRRTIVSAIVLVAVGAGLSFVVRDTDRADPLPTGVPLSGPAAELVSLTRRSEGLTYHATYRVIGAVVPEDGSIRIEAWRRGKLARVDQVVETDHRTVRTSVFQLEERSAACTRQDDEAWRCRRVAAPTDSDPLLGRVLADLEGKDVTVRTRTISGRRARCFTLAAGGQSSRVCLTPEGIALRYEAGNGSQELTRLERDVDADVFDPPA